MSSAKIVVLSLKEIIRVFLFVLCGLFVILLIVFMFLPKNDEASTSDGFGIREANGSYKNGEYISQIPLSKGLSYVKVTIDDNNIVDVSLYNEDEKAKSFYPLLDTVCGEINEEVHASNSIVIETDYNNQFTTHVLTSAINSALVDADNAK